VNFVRDVMCPCDIEWRYYLKGKGWPIKKSLQNDMMHTDLFTDIIDFGAQLFKHVKLVRRRNGDRLLLAFGADKTFGECIYFVTKFGNCTVDM
jgi:hypothetical protein